MTTREIIHRQIKGITSALTHLLPATDVATYVASPEELSDHDSFVPTGSLADYHMQEYEATVWVRVTTNQIAVFDFSRTLIPLSDTEREMLDSFTEVLKGVPFDNGEQESPQAELIANERSFQHLLVTQYLRGGPLHGYTGWSPGILINQLQDLVHKRYEGEPATSGFIVVNEPQRFLRDKIEPSGYTFEPFPEDITVEEEFFNKPASYRYVDGRTAFYVVDHHRHIHGIIRCPDYNSYGRIARVANKHLIPLMQTKAQDAWAGYIGNNNDINLVVTPRKHLRWLQSHWHLVDQYHLTQVLQEHDFAEPEIPDFVSVLLTVSDLRQGTLILIPEDRSNLPETIGHIDDTYRGRILYDTLTGRQISDLRKHQAALGMLTSDGLTTLAKSGHILGCGEIIRVDGLEGQERRMGGGRTLAAMAASQYGLVIKISQDGPISFFKDQEEHIRIVF